VIDQPTNMTVGEVEWICDTLTSCEEFCVGGRDGNAELFAKERRT
jgi:hypothetical protein